MENKEKIELREHLLNIRDKYSHTLGIYDFAFYQGHFKSLIDAFTIKTLEDDFGVLLTIKDGNDLTTYTRYISARNIIDITNDVKVINKILGDAVIAYNIISCKYEPDLMVAPDNEQYDVDSANKENNSNTEEFKKAWHEDYKNWIFIGDRQPDDAFMCIVKMFNDFSDTWTTGTGIFDNGEWEATDSSGESFPVRYWRRCPDFEAETQIGELKQSYKVKKVMSTEIKNKNKLIKSFIAVGDVIEVEHYGKPTTYKVEKFEVIPNSLYAPTEFVIHVKFSYNNGVSSIECTSDNFKYIRHISHSDNNDIVCETLNKTEDFITRALDFNLGDLVVLKSDATKVMTVRDVNSSYAVVCIFWSNDQLVEMELPIYTIEKI